MKKCYFTNECKEKWGSRVKPLVIFCTIRNMMVDYSGNIVTDTHKCAKYTINQYMVRGCTGEKPIKAGL